MPSRISNSIKEKPKNRFSFSLSSVKIYFSRLIFWSRLCILEYVIPSQHTAGHRINSFCSQAFLQIKIFQRAEGILICVKTNLLNIIQSSVRKSSFSVIIRPQLVSSFHYDDILLKSSPYFAFIGYVETAKIYSFD